MPQLHPTIKNELQIAIWLECMFAQWLKLRLNNGDDYELYHKSSLARDWFMRELQGKN